MRQITTCDSCGVQWVHKIGVDIKDHWYEFNRMMFCGQCHDDGNADEIATSEFEQILKENDWRHQPA